VSGPTNGCRPKENSVSGFELRCRNSAHLGLLQLKGELRVEDVAASDDERFDVHGVEHAAVFRDVSQEGHVTCVW
jgi:hypothetical protein